MCRAAREDVYLAGRGIAHYAAPDAVVRYIRSVAAQWSVYGDVGYTGAGTVYSSVLRCIAYQLGHVAVHSAA